MVLKDSLKLSLNKIYDFQIDLGNSIYFIDEFQNHIVKVDFETKKETKSKFYSNISQINLSNPFFISFVDENFNQVNFLDKELFETQTPFLLSNSEDFIFVKNNMELLSYSISTQEFCKVFYRKIGNYKNCRIYNSSAIKNGLINEDFLILISRDSIQINSIKKNTSSKIQLKNATNIKLFSNELFYIEDNFLYSIELQNKNNLKKWIEIKPTQKYSINKDFLVIENEGFLYFYQKK